MIDRILLLIADELDKQHGVLTREQAVGAGVSRHLNAARLDSGRWQRLHRGVFAAFSGVVVELDGVLAHPADGRSRDARRDNASTLEGYRTLRCGWVPVACHPCVTALEIFSLLRRNGLPGPFKPCGKACAANPPARALRPPRLAGARARASARASASASEESAPVTVDPPRA